MRLPGVTFKKASSQSVEYRLGYLSHASVVRVGNNKLLGHGIRLSFHIIEGIAHLGTRIIQTVYPVNRNKGNTVGTGGMNNCTLLLGIFPIATGDDHPARFLVAIFHQADNARMERLLILHILTQTNHDKVFAANSRTNQ